MRLLNWLTLWAAAVLVPLAAAILGKANEFVLIAGSCAFLVLALASARAFRRWQLQKLQRRWPEAIGVVKKVDILRYEMPPFPWIVRILYCMRAALVVEYVVDGTTYRTTSHSENEGIPFSMDARVKEGELNRKYKPGMEVSVFYQPENPRTSLVMGVLCQAQ